MLMTLQELEEMLRASKENRTQGADTLKRGGAVDLFIAARASRVPTRGARNLSFRAVDSISRVSICQKRRSVQTRRQKATLSTPLQIAPWGPNYAEINNSGVASCLCRSESAARRARKVFRHFPVVGLFGRNNMP